MDRAPGKIITFYSYKGGTGRSMTLANVAWLLASNGKRVLAVDWDLEAPGLHRYFSPFLVDRNLTSSEGIIDFVIDFATEAMTPSPEGTAVPRDWYVEHADLARYAASLEWDGWDFPGDGTLDFVSAGCQGPSYSTRVNTFDWQSFYDRHGGGVFLEAVKEKLREEYDYILLDSRTGVSDTSGICTVQMPDVLVVCFTLNNQSIEGASAIASSISRQRGSSGPRIFPVPMRIEMAETDKLEARREYARRRFALFPEHLQGEEREKYWGEVELLYVPYYAYEEVLAVFKDRPGATASLLSSAERLTSHLTGGEVKRLAPMPEPVRQEILGAYARRSDEEVQEDKLSQTAEAVFAGLSADDQRAARNLLTRLVRVESDGSAVRARVPRRELEPFRQVIHPFLGSGVLTVETEPSTREQIVQLADEGLITRWPRLRDWIDKDRTILVCRQILQGRMAEWESSKQDPAALLAGDFLGKAREALHEEDLTSREQAFLRASVRKRNWRWARNAAAAVVTILFLTFGYLAWNAERKRDLAAEAALSAKTAMDQGNLDQALKKYDEATALDPTLADAYLGRGQLYAKTGSLDRASREYDHALELDPSSEEAVLAKVDVLSGLTKPDEAAKTLDAAVRLNPANPKFRTARGDFYRFEGRNGRAVQLYTEAIQLSQRTKEHDESTYFNRGLSLLALGKQAEAEADFRHVSEHTTDANLRTAATAQLEKIQGSTTLVRPTTIFLRYQNAADAEVVNAVAALLEKKGVKIQSLELLRKSRTSGDVRYYFEEDKGQAAEVQQAVEFALAQAGYPLALELTFVGSTGPARPGQIEVWLPSLSRGASKMGF